MESRLNTPHYDSCWTFTLFTLLHSVFSIVGLLHRWDSKFSHFLKSTVKNNLIKLSKSVGRFRGLYASIPPQYGPKTLSSKPQALNMSVNAYILEAKHCYNCIHHHLQCSRYRKNKASFAEADQKGRCDKWLPLFSFSTTPWLRCHFLEGDHFNSLVIGFKWIRPKAHGWKSAQQEASNTQTELYRQGWVSAWELHFWESLTNILHLTIHKRAARKKYHRNHIVHTTYWVLKGHLHDTFFHSFQDTMNNFLYISVVHLFNNSVSGPESTNVWKQVSKCKCLFLE